MPTELHPYGTVLSAKEVCEATGFTMNQLRNWRVPARRDLAPFGFIAYGNTPWYRKDVIQDFLDEQGPQQGVYFMTERDKKFPIAVTEARSIAETTGLSALKKITSANVHAWIERNLDARGLSWVKTWEAAWADVEDTLGVPNNFVIPQNRWDHPEWWAIAVHTARKCINDEQDLGFDLAKIIEISTESAPDKETK